MLEIKGNKMKPSFKHDCDKCKFVGKIFRALNLEGTKKSATDLYESCNPVFGGKYILRCSSKGSDYITTDIFQEYMI